MDCDCLDNLDGSSYDFPMSRSYSPAASFSEKMPPKIKDEKDEKDEYIPPPKRPEANNNFSNVFLKDDWWFQFWLKVWPGYYK